MIALLRWYFDSSYFASSYFPPCYFPKGGSFIVKLKGEAAQAFGPVLNLINLAEKVMDYWDNHEIDLWDYRGQDCRCITPFMQRQRGGDVK